MDVFGCVGRVRARAREYWQIQCILYSEYSLWLNKLEHYSIETTSSPVINETALVGDQQRFSGSGNTTELVFNRLLKNSGILFDNANKPLMVYLFGTKKISNEY